MAEAPKPPILRTIPAAIRPNVIPLFLPDISGNVTEQFTSNAERFGPQYWSTLIAAFASMAQSGALDEQLSADQIIAACWLQLHPGKVASVHGPRFIAGHFSEPLADRLLSMAIEAACALHVNIAQAVVDLAPLPEQAAWYRAGFHRAAELLFMSCEISGNIPAVRDSLRYAPCRFEENQPDSPNNRRLADLVDATYAYSLDCPRLDGLRKANDVLAGYRATGHPDSSRWLLAYDAAHSPENAPIGCLFVADHPENNQCELVYMGIVPSHRGRGLGQALVSKALEISAELGRARLVLAVDADNWPAFRHYAGLGFRTFARKQVFMLALDGRQSPRSR